MHTRTVARGIIDCDIHNVVPAAEALFPFLAEHWREYMSRSDFKGPIENYYPAGAATSAHPDTTPPGGGPPGSDLALMREQVLDALDLDYGILNCAYAIESVHNPYAAAALASAVNDWQIAAWLEPEPRLRAALVVPSQHPDLAAQEIERLGDHPGFVQVFLPVRSAALYGNRRYHPIYAAAVRHDLAIGVHFGGAPGNPPTPTGWPSYYIEEYAGMAQVFQSQVISLIVEGVFDQFPTLRVALIESGFTWLPSLMWRLDKEWKGLRREVPWVKRLPSEYIRDHLRLTTQPIDAPPDGQQLQQIVEQLGSDELLMFSTDYPHRHSDIPAQAFPAGLPAELERKIKSENARTFYRLK
jgi:predicted TIM-barrel fold metal-dependent hydrolase